MIGECRKLSSIRSNVKISEKYDLNANHYFICFKSKKKSSLDFSQYKYTHGRGNIDDMKCNEARKNEGNEYWKQNE